MKNRYNSRELDKRLDELLAGSPVCASADFTARTISRAKAVPKVDDAFIDKLLKAMPAEASASFTARTLSRARSEERRLVLFLRPLMAAAASVAISLGGIWALEGGAEPRHESITMQQNEMSEIFTLAANLSPAAPLLDSRAADKFSSFVKQYE